ncbi:hypothetical protein CK510_13905, partial [Brunnivagina elsteri CCALA 953]
MILDEQNISLLNQQYDLIENQKNNEKNQTLQTLIVSMRELNHDAFRSPEFEFEDAICNFSHGKLHFPQFDSSQNQQLSKRLVNFLAIKSGQKQLLKSGCTPSKIEGDYDLFFFICQHFWDITTVNSIQGWR